MTVFRGYMIIMKRNLGFMFLYTGIFLFIMLMISGFSSRESFSDSMYQSSRLRIAVIDEDESIFSRGIIQCLSRNNDVTTEITDRNALAEELYYEKLDYVLCIPENAEALLFQGGTALEVTKRPGDGMYRGLYADMQIDTWLNTYRTYRSMGLNEEQAADKAAAIMEREAQVELRDVSGHGKEIALYHFYYRYLPYVLLYTLCYVIPLVMNNFNRKDIERRINSSGISAFRQGVQGILALAVLCGVFYLLLMILPLILYGRELLQDAHLGYYILNSACMTLAASSIAYLIGNLVKNTMAINGIANVTALGMSFLCGVFVDMNILATGVKAAAHFLPVYWYEAANITLYEFGTLTPEQSGEVWLGFGILLAMSIACLTVALIIRRNRVNKD